MREVWWEEGARRDLLSVPDVNDAAAVDAAVQYFARTGIRFVRQVEDELRLYVNAARYYVVFRADGEAVYVWRVFHW